MYRIYADDTLIYDSTLEDYKIGKGQIAKEADKSGSFVFSVYPDHPYYSQFVRMKTVVTVYKSGRIVFRGRILDDTTDYWNAKTITCEGELGFLQDSVARPFDFKGSPADLLAQFIAEHNSQHINRDEWKRFKVGTVTVVDENGQITRSAGGYGTMLDTMQSALPDSALGGHFYITHGDDGTDPIPTLHYVADFPKTAAQGIEFGVNLKDYTKKVSATDLATCIIPLGASNGSDGERLTIEAKNGGKDYIYDANAVAMYGWIVKVVTWDDVTLDNHLLTKGRAWLAASVNEHATIELNAIDLHLLDLSIESYNVCEYVHATSKPHGLDALMLCSKQTMDLLKPDNDTVTLGYSYGTFTGANVKLGASVSTLGKTMSAIKQEADEITASVQRQGESLTKLELLPNQLTLSVTPIEDGIGASIQLVAGKKEDGSPNTLGSPAEIKLTGVVTFSALGKAPEAGQTKINGGWIDTSLIRITALNGEAILLNDENGDAVGVMEFWRDAAEDDRETVSFTSYSALQLEGQTCASISAPDSYLFLDTDGVWCKGNLFPDRKDATYTLGTEDNTWDVLYADSCTGCYSDANKKHSIEILPDKYLELFDKLEPKRFKLNNGTSGRYHVGYTAQDVKAAMDAACVDSTEFGGWIEGELKDGSKVYMLRYEEFGAIYAAKIKQLEARVARLEGTA